MVTTVPEVTKRLLPLIAIVVLAAGVVAAVMNARDDGSSSSAAGNPLPTQAQINQERYGDTITPSKDAMGLASTFIKDAVLRQDLAAAWGMTTEDLRGASMTRDEWLTGNIPVSPYLEKDFGKAGFQIVYAREKSIMLLVLIQPKKGSTAPQQDYYLQLVPSGDDWLVNYWGPKGHLEAPVPTAG
jgi:hypothetical protein